MQKARLSHLETPGHYIIVTDPPTPEQLLLKLKTLIEQHGRLWRTTEEDGNAARELREAEAKTLHDMDELEQQAHRHLEERRQDPDLTPKLEAATDHPTIRIKREEDVRRTRTRYPGGGTGSGPPQPTAEPRAPPSADEVQTAKHGFQTALLFSPPTDREDWALGIQQRERATQLRRETAENVAQKRERQGRQREEFQQQLRDNRRQAAHRLSQMTSEERAEEEEKIHKETEEAFEDALKEREDY
jgi:hypothetical protein